MKVFMSWSGQRSKLTAELLYDWVKCVIQAAQPWISSKGIERGALWFSEINNELKDTAVGIICLTHENKNAPWILFEAGALAKGLSTNRVCTLLVDLKSTDLQPPLAQFNHTFPDKESMWSLVTTLNSGLELNRLDTPVLQRVFETYWPQFEESFADILKENPLNAVIEQRKDTDMLAEILETTRSMSGRIRTLEEQNINSIESERNMAIVRGAGMSIRRSVPTSAKNRKEAIEYARLHLRNGADTDDLLTSLSINFTLSTREAKDLLNFAIAGMVLPPDGDVGKD